MDPAQNLLAVVYVVTRGHLQLDKTVHVNLRAINDESIHPQAAGRTLVLSGLPKFNTDYAKLKGCACKDNPHPRGVLAILIFLLMLHHERHGGCGSSHHMDQ
jgi:hypothetical protein